MDDSQSPTQAAVAATAGSAPGDDDDWGGRTVGEFTILRRLGRGGMGQVFLAEQPSLRRKVAIKVLKPELAASERARKRFQTEAEAVAKLTHPNIVQIIGIGEHDGMPYMALEYVEGRNLRDFLNRKGPPDLPIALAIMKQVGAALQKAAEQNFVHRDIKPENILLSVSKIKDKDGKTATKLDAVKVADFGLSRCLGETDQPLNLTQSGVAMGTPLYMSPEQVQGKPADPRSDMYSFGVTCYHMLAGEPPFRGSSAFDVAVQHVQNPPPPLAGFRPDLPPDLCAVVHKMMAKKPDDRYQTAKEFLRDLARLRENIASGVTTHPVAASPDVTAATIPAAAEAPTSEFAGLTPPPKRPRRSGGGMLMASLIIVGLATLAAGVTVRFAVNKLTARVADRPPANVPDPPVTPTISGDERFAIDAAKQFADPRDRDDVRKGLNFQIDLAVYYFKQHRLDDAERFLRGLRDRPYKPVPGFEKQHPYVGFADLGLGLVLSFRDRPRESMDALVKVLPGMQPAGGGLQLTGLGLVIDHFELRRLVAEALNRNAKNLRVEKFTDAAAVLEPLRKPPDLGRPVRPFGK